MGLNRRQVTETSYISRTGWPAHSQNAVDMPAFLTEIAYMRAKGAVQYTLRQIPPALDEALRRKSRQDGKSINQTAIEVLYAGLALNGDSIRHRDLDFMVGSWVEDKSFDIHECAPRAPHDIPEFRVRDPVPVAG